MSKKRAECEKLRVFQQDMKQVALGVIHKIHTAVREGGGGKVKLVSRAKGIMRGRGVKNYSKYALRNLWMTL